MNQSYRTFHSLRFLLIIGLCLSFITSCKKEDNTGNPTPSSQTDLLVAHNWVTTSVTMPDGQAINSNRLGLETQVLFKLTMQFRSNGTVRALDPGQSNSVVNGGTWTLAADNQSMDVDVTGFKGNFPIVQLTKSKLILRQNAPVDGKKTDINLVFDPIL